MTPQPKSGVWDDAVKISMHSIEKDQFELVSAEKKWVDKPMHHLDDLKRLKNEHAEMYEVVKAVVPILEWAINATPSGSMRNERCDLNIKAQALLAEIDGKRKH